jgi:molecular chaperone IbpB
MEVSGATFTNGLLHIDLTRNVPDIASVSPLASGPLNS